MISARHSGVATQSHRDAEHADLHYVSSLTRGIRRQRAGKGFRYINDAGAVIRNKAVLRRIRELVIPPAWKDVTICTDPLGHIQAIGRDQRGRKQYRYHSRWRQARDENKFARMIDFGNALPEIRKQVKRDLKLPGLPRKKVIATIVKLLQCSHIRVGNEKYAKDNHSFGLTTMRNRHVRVNGDAIHLKFRGKSGVEHTIDFHSPRLAKIVRACQHLPGQELFQYLGEDGDPHHIGSLDVNEYLHQIAGDAFTAKDFRTWDGTVLAGEALERMGRFNSPRQAEKNILRAIELVAKDLGNTKTVCRKCYIHPAILDEYRQGTFLRFFQAHLSAANGLRSEEAGVLSFLKRATGSN